MALVKNISLESGIDLPTAYIKITDVLYYNHAFSASYAEISLNVFKDQTAREAGKKEVAKFTHRCSGSDFTTYFSLGVLNLEGNNVVNQAYDWLKTTSMYSGATDVTDDKES